MGEQKYNFEDDRSVADLLGSLPRVEAPVNFDARVRSRIAQGRPSSRTGWLIPSAAAASLCSVVLAVVGVVYIRNSYDQIAVVGQPENVPVIVSESPNPQFAISSDQEPANVIQQPSGQNSDIPDSAVAAEKRDDAPVSRPRSSVSRDGRGSYRIGVGESEAPRVPIGIPTPGTNPEVNIRPPGPVNKVSAREVLQLIGLDAEFRDDGWHVRKVSENSLAGRSGVRNGDVVEAINEAKIVENTTFESGFNGKNLTVLRNGSRQTISLQNR